MFIQESEIQGIKILQLNGRIDFEGIDELNKAVKRANQAGFYKFIMDMGNVDYLTSAGLHTLANTRSDAREHGGDLRLVRLSPIVRHVLNIARVRRFFRNYSNLDMALKAF